MEKESVWLMYEERQLSTNPDFNSDGFMLIWDSEEWGRNMSTCEIIKELEGTDDEMYDSLCNHLALKYGLKYGVKEDNELLDDSYFEEVFQYIEEKAEGLFYRFDYQITHSVVAVFKDEESAKKELDYRKNSCGYYGKRYTISESKIWS